MSLNRIGTLKRFVAIGCVCTMAFGLLGGCQSEDQPQNTEVTEVQNTKENKTVVELSLWSDEKSHDLL